MDCLGTWEVTAVLCSKDVIRIGHIQHRAFKCYSLLFWKPVFLQGTVYELTKELAVVLARRVLS